jgi:hypothetical protein
MLSFAPAGDWPKCFSAFFGAKEKKRQQMKSFSGLQFKPVGSYAIFFENGGPNCKLNETTRDHPKKQSHKLPTR